MAQALGKIPQTVPVYNQREADEKFAEVADLREIQDEITPLWFAQYYPDGSVKSAAEFTDGIKYDAPDTVNRTITVKPFCNGGSASDDNSSLVGRVVIPPFVDASGNGYISDDGTRFRVVGVSGGWYIDENRNLSAIIAPTIVTTIGDSAFDYCTALVSASLPTATTIGDSAFDHCTALTTVSFPAATTIGDSAFNNCTALTSVSLPAATTIGNSAFNNCTALTSVSLPAATGIGVDAFSSCTALTSASLPAATTIGEYAFNSCTALTSVSLPAATSIGVEAFSGCTALTSVDFGDTPRSSVPELGVDAFNGVPNTCKIIVPYTQYDAWTAASGWSALTQEFVRHAEKADKPATFTTGNLAALDADGNPTDAGYRFEVRNGIPYIIETTND